MAATIKLENGKSVIWHLKQPKTFNIRDVDEIVLDGEELSEARDMFPCVNPFNKKKSVRLFGELAQNLLENI